MRTVVAGVRRGDLVAVWSAWLCVAAPRELTQCMHVQVTPKTRHFIKSVADHSDRIVMETNPEEPPPFVAGEIRFTLRDYAAESDLVPPDMIKRVNGRSTWRNIYGENKSKCRYRLRTGDDTYTFLFKKAPPVEVTSKLQVLGSTPEKVFTRIGKLHAYPLTTESPEPESRMVHEDAGVTYCGPTVAEFQKMNQVKQLPQDLIHVLTPLNADAKLSDEEQHRQLILGCIQSGALDPADHQAAMLSRLVAIGKHLKDMKEPEMQEFAERWGVQRKDETESFGTAVRLQFLDIQVDWERGKLTNVDIEATKEGLLYYHWFERGMDSLLDLHMPRSIASLDEVLDSCPLTMNMVRNIMAAVVAADFEVQRITGHFMANVVLRNFLLMPDGTIQATNVLNVEDSYLVVDRCLIKPFRGRCPANEWSWDSELFAIGYTLLDLLCRLPTRTAGYAEAESLAFSLIIGPLDSSQLLEHPFFEQRLLDVSRPYVLIETPDRHNRPLN